MSDRKPPTIENAPGLTWRPRVNDRWEARWQCRTDIVQMGFLPKTFRLYVGPVPDADACARIAERCRMYQDAMHTWANKRKPTPAVYNGMLCTLIDCYLTDPESTFHSTRYATKKNYGYLCKRILEDRGSTLVVDIRYRDLKAWHKDWSSEGRIPMAHGLFGMLRTIIGFGATILEKDECAKVQTVLHGMKIPQGKPRKHWINADQATDLRAMAHKLGRPSIALAQAIQFDGTFRQKDVIGERVPLSEPGVSDVIIGNMKWLRGARWEEIDRDLVFTHTLSKIEKEMIVDLTLAPMVVEELLIRYPGSLTETTVTVEGESGEAEQITLWVPDRELLPAKGPVIISEATNLPYTDHEFRRLWRELAREAGIPDHVFNMDTRSGAITEATDSGVPLEDARHAAGHATSQMTGRYSRNPREKIARSMRIRAKSRKNGSRKQ